MSTFGIRLNATLCVLWVFTSVGAVAVEATLVVLPRLEPIQQLEVPRVAVPDNPFGGPVAVEGVQEKEAEEAEDDANDDDTPVNPKPPAKPIDPQLIQVELWDGSLIAGKIEASSLGIQTEFGRLEVPIEKIRKVLPGYGSYPKLCEEITALVAQLDDKDFDLRESAQRALVDKGLLFQNIIGSMDDGGSAERKKRLAEIQKEFDGILEELEDDWDSEVVRSLVEGDTIETESFSIVGKIQQTDFKLRTKFGDLTVSLADIKSGDRTVFQRGSTVEKSFAVKGEAFYQRKPVVTRLRVAKGDRVTIRGTGTVNWTSWNTVSSPTGLPNQGQYKGIPAGALTARIGSSGKVVLIGNKKSFTASSGGTLYLGIAMPDNYVNEASYRWSGNFRAKVKIEPAG